EAHTHDSTVAPGSSSPAPPLIIRLPSRILPVRTQPFSLADLAGEPLDCAPVAEQFLLGLPPAEEGPLAFELPVCSQALRAETALVHGRQLRAPGFTLVAASAKAAAGCQFCDVTEGLVQALLARPGCEFPQARGIDQHAACGEENEVTPGGCVAAPVVVLPDGSCRPDRTPGQPVDQARLADARRAQERGGAPGAEVGGELLHPDQAIVTQDPVEQHHGCRVGEGGGEERPER